MDFKEFKSHVNTFNAWWRVAFPLMSPPEIVGSVSPGVGKHFSVRDTLFYQYPVRGQLPQIILFLHQTIELLDLTFRAVRPTAARLNILDLYLRAKITTHSTVTLHAFPVDVICDKSVILDQH